MYQFIELVVGLLKKIVPEPVVAIFRKPYHWTLAFLLALSYGFPARKMTVIGVTGTKGKSSVADMLYAVFAAAGHQTALASTIRFAYPGHDEPNLFKMTMPGRGFLQQFLRKAEGAGAKIIVLEITSEGAKLYRHLFLFLDALVVTNIQREHIESHGSFENYIAAKRAIVRALEHSPKKNRVLVVNDSNEWTKNFLDADVPTKRTFEGAATPGEFQEANVRAVVALAQEFGISEDIARNAIAKMPQIKGRVEPVECGQDFTAIVDYAHTPDSLTALYESFPNTRKICVLGNTGGGRDAWKRPQMGTIAEKYCDTVILTNEDPYDENPEKIVNEMAAGMQKKPRIIMDRREAIRTALSEAHTLRQARGAGDQNITVLVTGKGTDPYIMEAHGEKRAWSDAQVVREELEKLRKETV